MSPSVIIDGARIVDGGQLPSPECRRRARGGVPAVAHGPPRHMTDTISYSVLLIEDDPALRQVIADGLEADGFAVAQARGCRRRAAIGCTVLPTTRSSSTCACPTPMALDLLDEALTLFPTMRAVVMTGFGGVSEAVTAIKRGAVDFLIKPFQLSQLSRVLRRAIEQQQLRQENAELRAQLQSRFRFDNIIGCSAPMRAVFSTLELVAPMNSTMLIEGETGTGKELIARTIHHNSPRHDQHFVAFNAAAIPDGARRGGAVRSRQGRVHRRRASARRALRAGAQGHAVHRRSLVDVAAAAGEAAARAAGAPDRAASAIRARSSSIPASLRPRTWICADGQGRARSARISTTG